MRVQPRSHSAHILMRQILPQRTQPARTASQPSPPATQPTATGPTLPLPNVPTVQPPSPPGLDALLSQWGQSGSMYDLNADGTVNAVDLAMLLGGSTPNPAEPGNLPTVNTDETSATVLTAPTQDTNEAQASPIDSLLAAWGQAESPHDHNGDGTVNAADLALVLGSLAPTPQAAPATSLPADLSAPTLAAAIDTAAQKVTNAVFNAVDLDGDDLIATSSLSSASSLGRAIDQDGDGVIARADLAGALQGAMTSAAQANPTMDFAALAQQWMSALLGTPASREGQTSHGKLLLNRLAAKAAVPAQSFHTIG